RTFSAALHRISCSCVGSLPSVALFRCTFSIGTFFGIIRVYTVYFSDPDRQDNAFNKATIQAFSAIPDKLKKSFTVDNGKEFAAHQELAEATGMKVYFCEPYSPWQRGTNENTNGLLRQFFPKGTSFANISNDDLQIIVDMINNRPRKRLNFLTPFEVLKKFFP
ncbi:MAG: IS30 family transposase, partial [Oscillospiraceae bacterium]|nr:IS30 family transposase [Oscillospiraceae bacterium]